MKTLSNDSNIYKGSLLTVWTVAAVVLAGSASPAIALTPDFVWMRHEPGELMVDHYGHDGITDIPETVINENGRAIGGGILGMAPLSNGGFAYGRQSVTTDWFVHNGLSLCETGSAEDQAGLIGSEFLDVVGVGSGNFVWGRKNGSNQADFFLHSRVTAAEIGRNETLRGLVGAPFSGMVPVSGGNFVWGRQESNENRFEWFLHDGNDPNLPELENNFDDTTHRGIGGGILGMAGLTNGNFAYARDDAGFIDVFINSGTTTHELANELGSRPLGTGLLGMIGLANGNFVYARSNAGGQPAGLFDLFLHDGTTAVEIANRTDVGGLGTFLGMAPLDDGSFIYIRENNANQIDLWHFNGTTLATIDQNLDGRGVGVDGILFEGVVGLVEQSPSDADGSGLVDGADFMNLQRCHPSAIPDWQVDFGGPPSAVAAGGSLAAVPEPSSIMLLLGMMAMISGRRTAVSKKR